MMPVLIILFIIGGIVLMVDQLRRLISFSILNRTIRTAMERQPESTPILIAKLEARPTLSGSVIGACLTIMGVAVALLAFLADTKERDATLMVALVPIFIGLTLLAATQWASRSTQQP